MELKMDYPLTMSLYSLGPVAAGHDGCSHLIHVLCKFMLLIRQYIKCK